MASVHTLELFHPRSGDAPNMISRVTVEPRERLPFMRLYMHKGCGDTGYYEAFGGEQEGLQEGMEYARDIVRTNPHHFHFDGHTIAILWGKEGSRMGDFFNYGPISPDEWETFNACPPGYVFRDGVFQPGREFTCEDGMEALVFEGRLRRRSTDLDDYMQQRAIIYGLNLREKISPWDLPKQ